MVVCSSGGSVRVSCLVQNVDGAGSEAENHPVQSRGTVLGCCSRPGNSEDEEDAVTWLKVARPAHMLCLRVLMFVTCTVIEFHSTS